MAEHLTVDELADAAAGLVDAARGAEITEHLAGCRRCAASQAELEQVSVRLAAEPTPPMPAAVTARLAAVIDAEQNRRQSGQASSDDEHRYELAHRHKPSLGTLGSDLAKPSRSRFLGRALVACVAAAAIGFAGYAAGARAGLGEPQALRSPLTSRNLAPQAEELRSKTDLDSHWLSLAWSCARKVTDGRITDIARVVVDGSQALLVYTSTGGKSFVTVVSGCPDDPKASTTTELPR
ncbi:anti-sigma factor family protein [Microlunatus speluncae]|uniref:anti-sigma factor family protein n=1 Tax=Microlunatus speluncae TaxID=2594267 RepID=UPI00126669E0|nr:hypothetical protein [Microlunatus speluncae]